ncbi:Ovule protein [Caenorhabditis elegans]|uniref:Ovule protein n=1 Tax=Caenorhabditis elegans TaxID=6239 RepID=D3DEL4_CAEEL|nr:Ovule protein [Caenorhabditis elegans]CBJ25109.1 Ovule protein [Caenorhabditis elegans]|eukprot:NP_001255751.1 Uncharacterized protein CELE_Y45F10B.59 [Caenorhabditis elegans]
MTYPNSPFTFPTLAPIAPWTFPPFSFGGPSLFGDSSILISITICDKPKGGDPNSHCEVLNIPKNTS